MSQGKYSPTLTRAMIAHAVYDRNCYGDMPVEYKSGYAYDEKTMFDNYDSEGYDEYGYSAFDKDGKYVGPGNGVDRIGNTENDYLVMDPEVFNTL